MKGHEIFNRTVRDLGFGPLFGNPGSTEIPMLRGTSDYVLTLHDSISVGMADGYAQFSGKPSIVNLHTLPGVANSMAFIHTARLNRSPVVITSGQQDSRHAYYEPLLWHDLGSLVGPAVKYSYEVKSSGDIEKALKRAYAISMEPPSGPVFISFPMDVMDQESEYGELVHSIPNLSLLDTGEVDRISELIRNARNPAFVAGAELDQYGGIRELEELACKLGIPVFSEPLASRATFNSNSGNFAGELPPATTAINLALLQYDLVVNFGGDFTIYPYLPSPLLPGKKIVTVSMSPTYKQGEYAISNPRLFLQALLQKAEGKWGYRKPEEQGNAGLIAREKRIMGVNYVLQKARKLFAGYTIVDEAISSSLLVRKNMGYSEKSYFTAKSGQLGWGLPAAAGISMLKDKVLEIVGDGSLMYTVQTLWTISRYNLPVKVLVLNNEGYTILKSFSSSFYPGVEKSDFLTFSYNIAEMAKALGIEARIADPELKEMEWLAQGREAKLLVANVPKTVPRLFI